jgi:hypothetical protein
VAEFVEYFGEKCSTISLKNDGFDKRGNLEILNDK